MDPNDAEDELRAEDRFEEILPLAMVIARAYRNVPGSTLDELRSEARLAAWDAARAFRPGEGRSFLPFARRVINNRLTDFFRKERNFRSVVQFTLDAPLAEDSDATSASQTPSRENRQGADLVCLREAKSLLTEILNELPHRQREILTAYMNGLYGSDIARAAGVTKQSISAIRTKALEVLRKKLGTHEVHSTLQLLARGSTRIANPVELDWGSINEDIDAFDAEFGIPPRPTTSLPTVEELLERAANTPIDDLSADILIDALLPEL